MTPQRVKRNYAASVHQRLLNVARARGIEFNRLLEGYTAERFLYRLSVSQEVGRYTLKGAALFRIWTERELRPTRDIDFLAAGSADRAEIHQSVAAICRVSYPEDGVVFDPESIRIDQIRTRHTHQFKALRVRIRGNLGRARLPLQVDIGFGDVITPEREERDYPTLLDLPAPRLWTYPRETMIAEKFHAMVSLGEANSRVKDLWDLACVARLFEFKGDILRTAIAETFRHQQTSIEGERPLGLFPSYYADPRRVQLWRKLRQQIDKDAEGPVRLADAGEEVRRFLVPVSDSLTAGIPFKQVWPAGGPWQPGDQARTGDDGGD